MKPNQDHDVRQMPESAAVISGAKMDRDGSAESSLIRRHQASISMRVGARLAGTEFALLAGLGTAGGTRNRQRFLLRHFHHSIIMPRRRPSKMVNFDQKRSPRNQFSTDLTQGETWIHWHMIGKQSRPMREQPTSVAVGRRRLRRRHHNFLVS